MAWYKACYEEARVTRENKKLSFAWLAYDVLASVKQQSCLAADEIILGGANPLYTMMDAHRKQYLSDNSRLFEDYRQFSTESKDGKQVRRAVKIVRMYVEAIQGLDEVLFLLDEWARVSKLFDNQPLRSYHFSLLFILFATRQYSSVDGNAAAFFKKIDEKQWKLRDNENETSTILTEKEKSTMVKS